MSEESLNDYLITFNYTTTCLRLGSRVVDQIQHQGFALDVSVTDFITAALCVSASGRLRPAVGSRVTGDQGIWRALTLDPQPRRTVTCSRDPRWHLPHSHRHGAWMEQTRSQEISECWRKGKWIVWLHAIAAAAFFSGRNMILIHLLKLWHTFTLQEYFYYMLMKHNAY